MDSEKIKKMLETDEGIRLKPYLCSRGYTTIGIGRNLSTTGISTEMAYQMLDEDVVFAKRACRKIFGDQFERWGENRQLGWVNLAFNIGFGALVKFKNTIRAAIAEDWDGVEAGLRRSAWYSQVGARAERVIAMICKEAFPYA